MASNPAIHRQAHRVLEALRNLHTYEDKALIGKHVELVLEKFDMLNIHQTLDPDGYVAYASRDGARQTAHRKDLLTALQAILGTEQRKVCRDCQEPKPLSAFSFDKSRDDGHNRSCLVCERARVKAHTEKKNREERGDA